MTVEDIHSALQQCQILPQYTVGARPYYFSTMHGRHRLGWNKSFTTLGIGALGHLQLNVLFPGGSKQGNMSYHSYLQGAYFTRWLVFARARPVTKPWKALAKPWLEIAPYMCMGIIVYMCPEPIFSADAESATRCLCRDHFAITNLEFNAFLGNMAFHMHARPWIDDSEPVILEVEAPRMPERARAFQGLVRTMPIASPRGIDRYGFVENPW